MRRMFLRPNMSERLVKKGWTTAEARRYEVPAQNVSVALPLSAFAIALIIPPVSEDSTACVGIDKIDSLVEREQGLLHLGPVCAININRYLTTLTQTVRHTMTRFTVVKQIVINHSVVPAFHLAPASRVTALITCEFLLEASLLSFSPVRPSFRGN